MNLNKLAKEVTLIEGKKKSISIAQVKEVINITLSKLSEYPDEEILKAISRYKK